MGAMSKVSSGLPNVLWYANTFYIRINVHTSYHLLIARLLTSFGNFLGFAPFLTRL